jgi:3-hydroxymyristoyl/3-hydroxydecanoyl-(acyl carrier protein) dehydratase
MAICYNIEIPWGSGHYKTDPILGGVYNGRALLDMTSLKLAFLSNSPSYM